MSSVVKTHCPLEEEDVLDSRVVGQRCDGRANGTISGLRVGLGHIQRAIRTQAELLALGSGQLAVGIRRLPSSAEDTSKEVVMARARSMVRRVTPQVRYEPTTSSFP